MIKFKQLFYEIYENSVLNELGDKPYPYEMTINNGNETIYKFKTDLNENYQVTFFKSTFKFLFMNLFKDKNVVKDLFYDSNLKGNEESIEVNFSKLDKYGQSIFDTDASKDYIKVFSTIALILKKEMYAKDIIMFSSKEPNRTKLYNRYVKSKENNYKVFIFPGSMTLQGNTIYLLIPKLYYKQL